MDKLQYSVLVVYWIQQLAPIEQFNGPEVW